MLKQIKLLSQSLESATVEMMKPNSIAREEKVFGNEFVEHFGGTREHEVKLWNEAVTNWEGWLFPSFSNFIADCVHSRAISRVGLMFFQ